MLKADIATQWFGTYRYNLSEYLPSKTPEVKFEIHLVLRWFGRFTGTIKEDGSGVPEPAEITGSIVGKKIRFKKRYKSLWMFNESGKIRSLPGQQSSDLYYEGKIMDFGSRIEGTWNAPSERRIINGEEWQIPESAGTWDAKRSSTS
jgi:hypothetical protein